MNGPFFRNQHPSRPIRSMPKVISVPVHFVSSQQPPTSKASSAIKIQKLFRGFLVRKSLKKIASIRNEVSEIERRIDQVADLIRRDAKERLRVNETLMSLLFKLDSIRGFDFGVRELRKAVTRKAIALQEKVDSIARIIEADNSVCTSTTSEQMTDEDSGNNLQDDGNPVKGADDLISEEDGKSREVVVKLMGDNEKMMKLMMQIWEMNEMQRRMINALSRRVEQLEKAFILKRKKKTRAGAASRKRDCCCMDA